jgi:hypothetical protein
MRDRATGCILGAMNSHLRTTFIAVAGLLAAAPARKVTKSRPAFGS